MKFRRIETIAQFQKIIFIITSILLFGVLVYQAVFSNIYLIFNN